MLRLLLPPAETSAPADTPPDIETPAEQPADIAAPSAFSPVTTPRLWEEATYDATVFNCVKATPASNPALTEEWAISYCVCILDQASRKYSFADYSAREAAIAQELNADGTMPWCIERAGRDAVQ